MKRFVLAVNLALWLGGVAYAQDKIVSPEKKTAINNCLMKNSIIYDDKISEAATIARATMYMCENEVRAYIQEALDKSGAPTIALADTLRSSFVELAVTIVLIGRAQNRKGNNAPQ